MSASVEIQIIACLISIACAMSGTFLVLRKMSLMTDSITHTILFGIVLAYFITKDLNSPFLIVGAALIGVFTVWLTELVVKTKIVSEDSAIGLVFPLLFSIAIIMVTKFADGVHLDIDSVLLGELAFAPFDRVEIGGLDLGPTGMWLGGILVVINLIFVTVLFRVLKLSTFDPVLATTLGFSSVIIHYSLMTLVSVTAVGAFQSAGSILVIAFMIVPAAAAYLLSDNLKTILILSAAFGGIASILGYQLARLMDASIAGAIAVVIGLIFAVALIIAPKRGILSVVMRRHKLKQDFKDLTLLFHLGNHQGTPDEAYENEITTIIDHIHWDKKVLDRMLIKLDKENKIYIENNIVRLTETGIEQVRTSYKSFFKHIDPEMKNLSI